MRRSIIVSVWLLLSAHGASAQEPIQVTEHEGLCTSILNSGECARIVEARQIPLSQGRARRDSTALHLRLTNNRIVTVVDDSAADFSYLGICSALGYYALWVQFDEGSVIRLISVRTGWSVFIPDLPIVSPDRRRFVTLSLSHESYSPDRLQVWLVEGDTLRKEWSVVPEYDDPHDVHWLSNRRFEFAHSRFQPTIAVVVDTAEIDNAGHWTTRLAP